jgi:hypothetical protein
MVHAQLIRHNDDTASVWLTSWDEGQPELGRATSRMDFDDWLQADLFLRDLSITRDKLSESPGTPFSTGTGWIRQAQPVSGALARAL